MTKVSENTTNPPLKARDFASNQEVRWCPGCGDYSILKQLQSVLAESGVQKEDVAIISGIGCSSRFPYYVDTYGMHSIHGRAPAVASGLRIANPDLNIWVVTGDGDGLSIGGNHFIHALRRNLNLNIMLFNNEIYGLTKGQYSPTSQQHKITKSTPMGSLDYPMNPLALALGANATFVARSMDRDAKHLRRMLHRSNEHQGTSLLEIYQNCNIFNDGAFFAFTEKTSKKATTMFVEHGKPLVFGQNEELGIRLDGWKPQIVNLETSEYTLADLWIHDETDLFKAQMLARFFDDPKANEHFFPRPFGVLYAIERDCYDDLLHAQVAKAVEQKGTGDLNALIAGSQTWTIA
ncbi:MAG: 2-oxoacid:ferredoxin oxidoreductase subunit beta [Chitinophagales bacterium]